jgi:hypothetical protein
VLAIAIIVIVTAVWIAWPSRQEVRPFVRLIWPPDTVLVDSCYTIHHMSAHRVELGPAEDCQEIPRDAVVIQVLRDLSPDIVEQFFNGDPCPDCRLEFDTVDIFTTTIGPVSVGCYRAERLTQTGKSILSACAARDGIGVRLLCTSDHCRQGVVARDTLFASLFRSVSRRASSIEPLSD